MAATHTRVLAVTSELPWPLNSGGHLRTFYLLRALARNVGETTLVVPIAGDRTRDIDVLRDAGLDVHAVDVGGRTRTGEARRGLTAVLRSEPYVFYHRHNWPRVAAALERLRAERVPNVLYLDHLDSFQYADRHVGAVPRVLDLHNVYSTLVERSAVARHPWEAAVLRREARLVRETERRAVTSVDLTLSVSDDDAAVFREWAARRVAVVPNGVDAATYADLPVGRPRVANPRLLFLGALSWAPNAAAANILATEILPRVRDTHPCAEAHIVGRAPTPDVLALAHLPGVHVFGDVPDVRPYLAESTLLVVPLDAGGGTRLKILEAFAAGLPVVSTPVGCEGLEVVDGIHLAIAERPHLAATITRVFDDEGLCRMMAQRARALVEASYDWRSIGTRATEAIAGVLDRQPPRP